MIKWIMTVGSNCADPAREKEFNDWYDNIDIPDVLKVPGFMRASRYEAVKLAKWPEDSIQEGAPKFLAIYDIESPDINQAIKDLREASRRMDESGRNSPLLVVLEAATYRLLAPPYEKAGKRKVSKTKWIYIVHGICSDPSKEKEFNDWYNNIHLPDITETSDFTGATRYELATVLQYPKGKEEVAKFLAIYDIESNDIEETMTEMHRVGKKLVAQGRFSPLFKDGGGAVYRQITEVDPIIRTG